MPIKKTIYFIGMMGEPGSYDASVYDDFEDKDQEGVWFVKSFGHVPGITIKTCNICIDEPLPEVGSFDGLVLAGSYNSVHDDRPWQLTMRKWLPKMSALKTPMLGICGSHQLLANILGSDVQYVTDGPCAGTFPVKLTESGVVSPLFEGLQDGDSFHYANSEHVVSVPEGATLLASSNKVPVAALDFGNHCYSTQFHPEGSRESLSTSWQNSRPELVENYVETTAGSRLVTNFLNLVVDL